MASSEYLSILVNVIYKMHNPACIIINMPEKKDKIWYKYKPKTDKCAWVKRAVQKLIPVKAEALL